MWNQNNYSKDFWDSSKCKYKQGIAILDGIDFLFGKMTYKDIFIEVHEIEVGA